MINFAEHFAYFIVDWFGGLSFSFQDSWGFIFDLFIYFICVSILLAQISVHHCVLSAQMRKKTVSPSL